MPRGASIPSHPPPARRSKSRARPSRRRPPPELREAGISVRKALGQHFLTSTSTLRRIADAAELSPGEDVIEIGAGLGALTIELSTRARRVLAIELDAQLATYLRKRFSESNVDIIANDALNVDLPAALANAGSSGAYVVAGNLPYRAAQPLLRHVLETRPAPRRVVVMVQAEVAKSIVATPGEMTLLGVSVQLYGKPRILFRVPPSAFYPPPKVRSAVVGIDISSDLRAPVDDIEEFFRVVRAGFGTRRKQIRNALANGLDIAGSTAAEVLAAANIDPTRRPQTLSLDDWAAATRAWKEHDASGYES